MRPSSLTEPLTVLDELELALLELTELALELVTLELLLEAVDELA
jgi:hypothetical protein